MMQSFDQRAREWDDDPQKVERARAVATGIRDALPLTRELAGFEYGCGTGLLGFELRNEFASITMADTSVGMLKVLSQKIKKSHLENLHPIRLDLLSDPLPRSRFDVIFSLMTLHHIPDVGFLLRRFYEILNRGGYIGLSDLDKEDGSFHGPDMKDIHLGFDRSDLQVLSEVVGFQDVRFKTIYTIKKDVGGFEKSFPLFLMTAQKSA